MRKSRNEKKPTKNVRNVKSKDAEKEMKKNKKDKKDKFWKRHPKFKKFIITLVVILVLAIIIGAGVFVSLISSDQWGVTKDKLTLSNMDTIMFDKDGNETASVSGEEKRKAVPLTDIPQNLQNAFVCIEDERFYSHHGVDIKRTLGATASYIIHKGNSSYGIAGVQRKIREIARAYQVEKILSKDQILELYLNIIFMGGDIHGVELGSKYYFDKSVGDLDLAQCAFLAGINHSPNNYNPYGDTDNSAKIKKRTLTVLGKMKELNKISDEEYNTAKKEVEDGLQFKKGTILSGSTMSYIDRAALNQVIKQYADDNGFDLDYATTKICGGGYKIYTTADSNIQNIMQEIYADEDYIVKNKTAHAQSAMVIMDFKTGRVVGTMGGLGTDVNSNGLNRATQSTRQPGSSIKPIASIAPGLENGVITAGTVYDDSPTSFGSYRPKNSGNNYQGLCTVRKAIEVSANVVEVKIMSELGPGNSIDFLRQLGITSLVKADENKEHNDENLSMVLGGLTNGISPLEMAGAYSAIANDGVYITPTFYTRVENTAGEVVLQPTQEKTRVMSPENAFIEKSILTGPVIGSNGTARGCRISGIDVGAKTGTTDDNKDRWLCGFTPYYAAATWYGYDNNDVLYTGYTNYAAKIWAAVMKKVHSGLEEAKFIKPDNVVTATICMDSGKRATESCSRTYTEYFVRGTVPDYCEGHKILTICKDTNKIATEFCPNTEEKTVIVRPEKEDTTLWKTDDNGKYTEITETCTEHTHEIVKMPDVTGMMLDETEKKLKALGLKITVINDKKSDKPKGTVIKQSISAGETINSGDSVTITVSNKGKNPTNPDTNTTTETNTITNETPEG